MCHDRLIVGRDALSRNKRIFKFDLNCQSLFKNSCELDRNFLKLRNFSIPSQVASLCCFCTIMDSSYSNDIFIVISYLYLLYQELELVHMLKSQSQTSHTIYIYIFILKLALITMNWCQNTLKIQGFGMHMRRTLTLDRNILFRYDITPTVASLSLKQTNWHHKRHINRIQDC